MRNIGGASPVYPYVPANLRTGLLDENAFCFPKILLSLLLLPLFVCQVNAQAVPALESIQSQAELDKAISSLDSALFDAYNRCDLEKFSSFFG